MTDRALPSPGHADAEPGERRYVRRVLIALGLTALAGLAWLTRDVLLLLFGAVLVAVALRGAADLLRKVVPVPERPAILLVVLILLVAAAGGTLLLGTTISTQATELTRTLPESLDKLEQALGQTGWGRQALGALGDLREAGADTGQMGQLVNRAAKFLMSLASALGNLLLILFAGLYLALQPNLYKAGLRHLTPKGKRGRLMETMDEAGKALRGWLLGTGLAMLLVGALTTAGLYALGVPGALALGLLAGLLEFVPVAGPILAALPAVLLAFLAGPEQALWVALFYLALQQVEGNLLQPVIQRRVAAVPPVVTLFSLLVFGSLFGPLGVVFAVPLAVVAMVFVNRFYVEDALGDPNAPSVAKD
ncbi:MAG TPA: AI-2E family transporter [Azospirillaceae bacterium]|nr:AI-2E family transporter [Azospirillaceae bacterium]